MLEPHNVLVAASDRPATGQDCESRPLVPSASGSASSGLVSVIIPTYNREQSLRRTLTSLIQQTLPPDAFEVIVADDGSSDGTRQVALDFYPFRLSYVPQHNQGATAARNNGALASHGQLLVFVDDDVTLDPGALAALRASCLPGENIAVGTLLAASEVRSSLARYYENTSLTTAQPVNAKMELPFVECKTGLLAVTRQDFMRLGMFQDPTYGGWPNWDDVYFGYRAHLNGLRVRQCADAMGYHWDYSLRDLDIACRRWRRASATAIALFQTCPALEAHLPMFHDKRPIRWRHDPLHLVLRKLARVMASSVPVLGMLELAARVLELWCVPPPVIGPLYRWIIGGYIYLGVRDGLRVYSC